MRFKIVRLTTICNRLKLLLVLELLQMVSELGFVRCANENTRSSREWICEILHWLKSGTSTTLDPWGSGLWDLTLVREWNEYTGPLRGMNCEISNRLEGIKALGYGNSPNINKHWKNHGQKDPVLEILKEKKTQKNNICGGLEPLPYMTPIN